MDDGMQFAERIDNSDKVRFVLTATGQYGRPTRSGGLMFLSGDSLTNEFEEEIAQYVSWHHDNVQVMVILPGMSRYEAISLAEYEASLPTSEAEEISEVVETEEVASTETETESDEVIEKNFKAVVKGGRQSGTHGFDTLAEAKEFVSFEIGKCSHVYIQGMPRSEAGCYWDMYQQYRQDWKAGKFDAAFIRDLANEEAARSGK